MCSFTDSHPYPPSLCTLPPPHPSSSSMFPAIFLGFTTLGEIFAYVTILQSNHRGSHIPSLWMMMHAGCVFVAGIHPFRTWMSGSFESVRWNACVHGLNFCLYCLPKEFMGNEVRTHVNSVGKIPSTWGSEGVREVEPSTLHHAEQPVQHTVLVPTPTSPSHPAPWMCPPPNQQ